MPGVHGLEMLSQLKTIEPSARVIICSADIQEYTRQEALRLGAIAFIQTPIDPQPLRAAVTAALERYELCN